MSYLDDSFKKIGSALAGYFGNNNGGGGSGGNGSGGRKSKESIQNIFEGLNIDLGHLYAIFLKFI